VAAGGMRIADYDPQARAVGLVVAWADRTSKLSHLEARTAEQLGKDTTRIVDQIAESLANENGVDVARGGLFQLFKVVIGKRLFERDFKRGGRLVLVRDDSNGHGEYGFTPGGLFRIGASGENGEDAVELFGEHDAGEFVGEGHGAERKFLVGALA
jgi:hypothetical protein